MLTKEKCNKEKKNNKIIPRHNMSFIIDIEKHLEYCCLH